VGVFTIHGTTRLLIERYYMLPKQSEKSALVTRPSAPLGQHAPIEIVMSNLHRQDLRPLKRIGISIGTYQRENPGVAELRLTTPDGHVFSKSFDLPDLVDNGYKIFELDAKPYSSGKILSRTGGGISAWEVHGESGLMATCLVFEYLDGSKEFTRGCPRPGEWLN